MVHEKFSLGLHFEIKILQKMRRNKNYGTKLLTTCTNSYLSLLKVKIMRKSFSKKLKLQRRYYLFHAVVENCQTRRWALVTSAGGWKMQKNHFSQFFGKNYSFLGNQPLAQRLWEMKSFQKFQRNVRREFFIEKLIDFYTNNVRNEFCSPTERSRSNCGVENFE